MKLGYTQRGFGRIEFQDANSQGCSIQESSSATEHKLWIGINEVKVIDYAGTPRVLDLKPLGGNVQALGRMHLTQKHVQAMLPALHTFVETGQLYSGNESTDESATDHPQWSAWLSWYGHNYTSFVPMRNNYPDNPEQALSWETWKAVHSKVPKWKSFGMQRPDDETEIIWCDSLESEGFEIGYYMEEDAVEWQDHQLWISYEEVKALGVVA